MKQKWWILLTLLLCGCGASSQPDQTGTVQNDRPRLSASMEETAENVAAVEKNENLEKNPSNSNQNPGEGQNWTVFAMDTVMQFDAYGGSANLQEKLYKKIMILSSKGFKNIGTGKILTIIKSCESNMVKIIDSLLQESAYVFSSFVMR